MADRQSDSLKELRALKNCLNELERHAESSGAALAAHLIGAAANALEDEIFDREVTGRVPARAIGIRYDA